MSRQFSQRPGRLRLEALETRDNPSFVMSQVGGVLTITGHDQDDRVEIRSADGSLAVTATDAQNTTQTADFANVTSVRLFLLGGTDSVTVTGSLRLPGTFLTDFGAGDSTFVLGSETDDLSLGRLVVRARDGADAVTVRGGPTGTIGALRLDLGDGDTAVTLDRLKVTHKDGFQLFARDGIDSLTLTNSQMTGVRAWTGKGALTAQVTNSGLGVLVLQAAPLSGDVAVALDGTDVVGRVRVVGDEAAVALTGEVSLGSLIVLGWDSASLSSAGSVAVGGALIVRAGEGTATADVIGNSLNTGGRLTVLGTERVAVSFDTDQLSRVGGAVLIAGGDEEVVGLPGERASGDSVFLNSQFGAVGDVRIQTRGGADTVTIGDALIGGAGSYDGLLFSVDTGSGDDTVTLNGVRVKGQFKLWTGAGADAVAIEGAFSFGSVWIDQGAGDDSLAASTVGGGAGAGGRASPPRPVYVRQGAGNDTVTIGSGVVGGPTFNGPGSLFDGGSGYDTSNANQKFFTGEVEFVNYENADGPPQ